MKILSVIFIYIVISACSAINSASKPANAAVPASLNHIETYRINHMLVRVLRHNMEIDPKIEFELFSTPDMKLVDSLSFTYIILHGQRLDFAKSNGAFVEDIREQGGRVLVVFNYFYSGGGSDVISCYLAVKGAVFGDFSCEKN